MAGILPTNFNQTNKQNLSESFKCTVCLHLLQCCYEMFNVFEYVVSIKKSEVIL